MRCLHRFSLVKCQLTVDLFVLTEQGAPTKPVVNTPTFYPEVLQHLNHFSHFLLLQATPGWRYQTPHYSMGKILRGEKQEV